MTTIEALKAYFNNPPLTNPELIAFVKGIPKEERVAFAREVCAALGVDYTPSGDK